jgi:hypothetical protein
MGDGAISTDILYFLDQNEALLRAANPLTDLRRYGSLVGDAFMKFGKGSTIERLLKQEQVGLAWCRAGEPAGLAKIAIEADQYRNALDGLGVDARSTLFPLSSPIESPLVARAHVHELMFRLPGPDQVREIAREAMAARTIAGSMLDVGLGLSSPHYAAHLKGLVQPAD